MFSGYVTSTLSALRLMVVVVSLTLSRKGKHRTEERAFGRDRTWIFWRLMKLQILMLISYFLKSEECFLRRKFYQEPNKTILKFLHFVSTNISKFPYHDLPLSIRQFFVSKTKEHNYIPRLPYLLTRRLFFLQKRQRNFRLNFPRFFLTVHGKGLWNPHQKVAIVSE